MSGQPDARARFYNHFGADDNAAPRDPMQAILDAADLDAFTAALDGTGWVDGCQITTNGSMTIHVGAGNIKVHNQRIGVVATDIDIDDPDNIGQLRRDGIRVDSAGVPYVVNGQSRAQPVQVGLHRDDQGRVDEVLLDWLLIEAEMPDGILDEHVVARGFPVVSAAGGGADGVNPIEFERIISNQEDVPVALSHSQGWSDFTFYDPTPGFEAFYALYVNSAKQPFIVCRGVNDPVTSWKKHNLAGSAVGGMNGADYIHTYVVVGMDPEGFLHVSGNAHAESMNYCKSRYSMHNAAAPDGLRDISIFDDHANMTSANERHFTFPLFFNVPGPDSDHPLGTLFFVAAQSSQDPGGAFGGPDGSNFSLKRYENDGSGGGAWRELGGASSFGRAWAGVVALSDGEDSTIDAAGAGVTLFLGSLCIDANGDAHMTFNWRGQNGTGPTGEGWYYAKLTNLDGVGNTVVAYKDVEGTVPLVLPIAHPTSTHYASTHKPTRVANFAAPNFINNAGVAAVPADVTNRPHVGFMYIVGTPGTVMGVGGSIQQFRLWYDPALPDSTDPRVLVAGWHVQQMTHFQSKGAKWVGGDAGAPPAGSTSRFITLATPTGLSLVVGCWPAEGLSETLWCYDMTGVSDTDPVPRPFALHKIPDQTDFHFEFNALKYRNEFMQLVRGSQRYWQDPGDISAGFGPELNSAGLAAPATFLGLYRCKLDGLDTMKGGQAPLPRLVRLGDTDVSNIRDISASTPTGVGLLIRDAGNLDGNQGAVVIGLEHAGKQLFARLKVVMHCTTDSGFLAACVLSQAYQSINPQVQVNHEAGNTIDIVQVPDDPPDAWSAAVTYGKGAIVSTGVNHDEWISMQAANHGHNPTTDVSNTWWSPNTLLAHFEERVCGLAVAAGDPEHSVFTTAWAALPNFRDLGGTTGRLTLAAWRGNGGIGQIDSATIELAALEGG